ncbi:hypothetical protein KNP414_07246 [Paenibacillus mucilaginosus KNP414]|uniref:Uncharacterized protein n=1 Tax=Paenibacillus mucilaginosus (strain KNP414) TaxID=1036673 RepID=F8FN86_PAEMK|nr:hypothetical protein KNP414_07246 [Paenibacillus mucilaginosus KNP414]
MQYAYYSKSESILPFIGLSNHKERAITRANDGSHNIHFIAY